MLSEMNLAVRWAMPIVNPSRDSRTPPHRPSMTGRIPTFGNGPRSLFTGGFIFIEERSAIGSDYLAGRMQRI
jgi:hypothetical protein